MQTFNRSNFKFAVRKIKQNSKQQTVANKLNKNQNKQQTLNENYCKNTNQRKKSHDSERTRGHPPGQCSGPPFPTTSFKI